MNMTCEAFPFGIPKDITFSKIEHNKVMKEQIGDFVFKEKPEMMDYALTGKARPESDIKQRQISDRSFRIYNIDGTLFAEMFEGKWVKKPPGFEEEKSS